MEADLSFLSIGFIGDGSKNFRPQSQSSTYVPDESYDGTFPTTNFHFAELPVVVREQSFTKQIAQCCCFLFPQSRRRPHVGNVENGIQEHNTAHFLSSRHLKFDAA